METPGPRNNIRNPFRKFAELESASGLLLLLGTVLALVCANSPWGPLYQHLRELPLGARAFSLERFVNDVLMAVFFLLVGLEIKREMLGGELASLKHSVLPLAAALGGMLVPAAIFCAWNRGLSSASGWGIPMATDIAFALGVVTLLGKRVPAGLKVFLVALAIIDDIGAILVIAVFYTGQLHLAALSAAAGVLLALVLLNRGGVRHPAPYLLGGALLWLCVFQSGIHATIAGVLLAFCIPHRSRTEGPTGAETDSMLQRIEWKIHPWVSFGILPLFALVNAGVAFSPAVTHALSEPLGLGILTGLCLGKPLGITLFAWVAVRFGWAALPASTRWSQLAGAGLLGGIGFTMSIFIAGLGLPDRAALDGAKAAVLAGSLLAGCGGYALLRFLGRERPT